VGALLAVGRALTALSATAQLRAMPVWSIQDVTSSKRGLRSSGTSGTTRPELAVGGGEAPRTGPVLRGIVACFKRTRAGGGDAAGISAGARPSDPRDVPSSRA
jgi:hypothetical protein